MNKKTNQIADRDKKIRFFRSQRSKLSPWNWKVTSCVFHRSASGATSPLGDDAVRSGRRRRRFGGIGLDLDFGGFGGRKKLDERRVGRDLGWIEAVGARRLRLVTSQPLA